MSEGKPMTTWTCDRCGVSVVMPSSDQPKWLGVYVVTPPRRDPSSERRAWVFCPDCDTSFVEWKRAGAER